jgi:zinc transport system substrate-binding protein
MPSPKYLPLLLALTLGCNAATTASKSPWPNTGKLKVLTSLVPIYCLTAQIAGDDAEVMCLLTAHGPHDFSPTSEDVRLLSDTDLFFIIGLGLEESFTRDMVKNAGNRKLKQIFLGNSLPKDRVIEASGIPHYHGKDLVTHTGPDPHIWLGLDEALLMVDTIRDTLVDRDAKHAANYKQRAEATKEKLTKLKDEFASLGAATKGGLITFHDSFRYFARTFNFDIAGTIRDVRGEQPLSPAALREQADEFRKKNVTVIGVEPQYPRGVAENLAKEMGGKVKIIDLDPIETGPTLDGQPYKVPPDYYFDKMRDNLNHLRQAFQ